MVFSDVGEARIEASRADPTFLRHSVAVALEKNRIHPSLAYRLMGHGLPGGVHATTYLRSLSYPMKELSEAIEKITFPVL